MSSNDLSETEKDSVGYEETNYTEARYVTDWLRNRLNNSGVTLGDGSLLDKMMSFINEHDVPPTAEELDNPELLSQWLEAAGTLYVVRKVKIAVDAAYTSGDLLHADAYNPHIRLLTKGRAAQNIGQIRDDASNKLIELVIAVSCDKIGDDVELDDPDVSSGGKNPDVLVTLYGRKLTLACKTPSTAKEGSWWYLIEDGVRQIDAAPGIAIGCVVLNLKNAIDHNSLRPYA